MTLRHLKLFIAVAESGKMSLAAAQYYVSQPTVSQTIAELEAHYQVLLFERLSKRLYITDAGRTLLAAAKQVVSSFDGLENTMRQAYTKQPLRLGTTVTIGTCLANPLIDQFHTVCPETEVQVVVNNTRRIEELLLASKLDLALVEGEIKSADLTTTPVFDDQMVLICSPKHRFASSQSIRLRELAEQPLVLREPGSGTRELFENRMQEHEIPIHEAWVCNNSEAIKNAVIANHGVSVLSLRLAEQELKQGQLCAIPLREENPGESWTRKFCLSVHKNKYPSPAMNAMLETIHQYQDRDFSTLLSSPPKA